jgi:non-ribosomal peptide synthetase component F
MADEDDQGEQTESKGPQWRQLEKQVKDVETENKRLREQIVGFRANAVQQAVAAAGFKPEDKIAVLLTKEYEGRLGDEMPSAESFAALVDEFGVTPTPPASEVPATPSLGAQIAAMQQQGAQLVASGQPPAPPADIDSRIAEAEAAGDFKASMALKLEKQGIGV